MCWGVSTCCGSSYEENTLSDCCGVEMHDDYDICPSCKEHTDAEGYVCDECNEWFEEPIEEYEYEARVYENAMEERADARRKYGE